MERLLLWLKGGMMEKCQTNGQHQMLVLPGEFNLMIAENQVGKVARGQVAGFDHLTGAG